jgi:hypothetical protein
MADERVNELTPAFNWFMVTALENNGYLTS